MHCWFRYIRFNTGALKTESLRMRPGNWHPPIELNAQEEKSHIFLVPHVVFSSNLTLA
jgi:hypothetical protein